jgi:hypothetical protein
LDRAQDPDGAVAEQLDVESVLAGLCRFGDHVARDRQSHIRDHEQVSRDTLVSGQRDQASCDHAVETHGPNLFDILDNVCRRQRSEQERCSHESSQASAKFVCHLPSLLAAEQDRQAARYASNAVIVEQSRGEARWSRGRLASPSPRRSTAPPNTSATLSTLNPTKSAPSGVA